MDHLSRIEQLRGPVPAKRHNARTIAALTGNPGCRRRAVLDAAGVDKPQLAQRIGYSGRFGQSRFALARGNAFEAMLKARDGELLRSVLGGVAASYVDVGSEGSLDERAATTFTHLSGKSGQMLDHPLLTVEIGGQTVYLEPDLIAYQPLGGRLQVVEIKSFAIIDGQADSAKVSAAAVQAAVYVLALRRLLGDDRVSYEVVLVAPVDFSLTPVAVVIDVRKQLSTLRRQLSRLATVSSLISGLPPGVSFDLTRTPAELIASLTALAARYAPECLSTCEMSVYCRNEAAGTTAALGRDVREALGGIESVADVLALAGGTLDPGGEQTEAAALLRAARQLRDEALKDEALQDGVRG